MFLSLDPPASVGHAFRMVSEAPDDAEAKLLGAALKQLRKRAGMTLAEAGDALPHPEDMSGQAWGFWERGERPGIHQPANQARLAKAIQATRDDLLRERDRIAGRDIAPQADEPHTFEPPPPRTLAVPVQSRARPDAAGARLVYDAKAGDAVADLSWLFGPTAGHLRMADDRLKGRVAAGQIIHYDRELPPRTGQVCVVETREGLHVYEYGELSGGRLAVRQLNPAADVAFEMADVRGVYAVRLIGD